MFISREEAVALIKDDARLWISGCGGGINDPDLLLAALEHRFITSGSPKNLHLYHSAGIGYIDGRGIDRLAHENLVSEVVGSHWSWSQKMSALARAEKIEAYVLPQGTMKQLTREIAGNRPGLFTKIGIGTFIDPRLEGGKMNARSKKAYVSLFDLEGEEYLFYKSFPIDVAIIRGSIADPNGNVSFEDEGFIPEALSLAQAAKNSGGIVLCQVKARGDLPLDPQRVTVPARLIDAIVVCPEQTFSYTIEEDKRLVGKCTEYRAVSQHGDTTPIKQIIAERAMRFLIDGQVVNLGFGVPSLVGELAMKNPSLQNTCFTLEQGIWGGIPAVGSNFGVAYYPTAMVSEVNQFDFYDGGGLDTAVLSFAEFDKQGNVNVSKFGGRINGVGGFINISQSAKRVIFVGTFTAGGLVVDHCPKEITVVQEGKRKKIVNDVQQISFSGAQALKQGQEIYYVTERAVFTLTSEGVALIEVSEGIDLEKDILQSMEFTPLLHLNH